MLRMCSKLELLNDSRKLEQNDCLISPLRIFIVLLRKYLPIKTFCVDR